MILDTYKTHTNDRIKEQLPPLPLNPQQTAELIEYIKDETHQNLDEALNLLLHKVPAGVDQAAYIKAGFLNDIANKKITSSVLSPEKAIQVLGTMLGGYNVQALVPLLDSEFADEAVKALAKITLVFDALHDVVEKHNSGNKFATALLESWARADWFTSKNELPNEIKLTVFKVDGETNTDDLSPAQNAWSRADIPLHAQSMLINKMPEGLQLIEDLKKLGNPLVYVGDVVGTGLSRKSAINSLQWHMGNEIPFIPNKHTGGYVFGSKIAPIFFNTAEDSGALPIECDVSNLNNGDEITILTYEGKIINQDNEVVSNFNLAPITMSDEVQAGGRIALIIGRGLTDKPRIQLGQDPSDKFIRPGDKEESKIGYTLAQKMVGKAC